MKQPTNHFSVYLIKEEYTLYESILKNYSDLKSKEIEELGTFFYDESNSYRPHWLKKFFIDSLDDVKFTNASSKGILLVKVDIGNNKNRIFAIPFGQGWTMLNKSVWEERFGLKTTLSIIKSDGLRKISKKNMTSIPKDTNEQLSRAGIVADFGIDIEQDLIQAITGTTEDEQFGKTITGKDAFSVSAKINIKNIYSFLKTCYDKYISDDYKKEFGWIDQIAEIKDVRLIEKLENQLMENINNRRFDKTWMAVPQIIEWEDVEGFYYSLKKGSQHYDDIRILGFLESLDDDSKENMTIGVLKGKEIYCISSSSSDVKYSWKAYDCIYCEVLESSTNQTYLLSNGKWFEIESDFADSTNREFYNIRDAGSSLSLPEYNHSNENDYNESTSSGDPSMCCMDAKNISFGGGHSKIEFCDIFTTNKKIIHIKKYGGSSVLSHLFAQGAVSGELFLADKDFRDKVNEKLASTHQFSDTTLKPNPEDYEVIFGIISSSKKDLDIPFFSKVSLRNTIRRLKMFGYNVSILKISTQ